MTKKYSALGNVIRSKRKELGMTLRKLAKASSLSFSYLSKVERGESQASRETIQSLADVLLLDIEPLLMLGGWLPKNYNSLEVAESDRIIENFLEDTRNTLEAFTQTEQAELMFELQEYLTFKKKIILKKRG